MKKPNHALEPTTMAAAHLGRSEKMNTEIKLEAFTQGFVRSIPGPQKNVCRLLWILWFFFTISLTLQHRSWYEVSWSPAILVVALTWRWWFLFPLCYVSSRMKLRSLQSSRQQSP